MLNEVQKEAIRKDVEDMKAKGLSKKKVQAEIGRLAREGKYGPIKSE